MSQSFYRAFDDTVRQGDIVIQCPIFLSLQGLSALGTRENPKPSGVRVWVGGDMAGKLPAAVLTGAESEIVARGKLTMAILLTRGCDVEQTRIRQVAPIFPLSMIQGSGTQTAADAQASVIDGKTTSLHYLPAEKINDWVTLPDSYVDFRYVTTLRNDLFDRLQRVAGLTQSAVGELMLSWIRHATGKDIADEAECDSCGARVSIFDEVAASLTPDDASF